METWDAIRSRRNVRAYERRPIAAADLDRILEAARRTPSASNRQRWDLVVCACADRTPEPAALRRGRALRHLVSRRYRDSATDAVTCSGSRRSRSRKAAGSTCRAVGGTFGRHGRDE